MYDHSGMSNFDDPMASLSRWGATSDHKAFGGLCSGPPNFGLSESSSTMWGRSGQTCGFDDPRFHPSSGLRASLPMRERNDFSPFDDHFGSSHKPRRDRFDPSKHGW